MPSTRRLGREVTPIVGIDRPVQGYPSRDLDSGLRQPFELGILYANVKGTTIEFYRGANLYMLDKPLPAPIQIEVDELLREGWVVD